ncbi:protein of unknown function [Serratia sp. Tan611]|nr:protein of unknown function [Serratia sp. Tan611]
MRILCSIQTLSVSEIATSYHRRGINGMRVTPICNLTREEVRHFTEHLLYSAPFPVL